MKKFNSKHGSVPTVSTIGGATGSKDILDMWKHHYDKLLSSSKDTSVKEKVADNIGTITSKYNYKPIAITCIFSRLLELLTLSRIKEIIYSK